MKYYLWLLLFIIPITIYPQQQYVTFKVSPSNALLRVNGQVLLLDADTALVRLKYGTYHYQVSCANYRSKEGVIVLSDSNKIWKEQVSLSPAFGRVKVNGNPTDEATLFIDNERKGLLPFVSEPLPSGPHNIKVVKKNYKLFDTTIIVNDDSMVEVFPVYKPDGVRVALVADEGTEIYVDGMFLGKGEDSVYRYFVEGKYEIEVRKSNQFAYRKVYRINSSLDGRCITLPSLTKQYGKSIHFKSYLGVGIWIDGDKIGSTPFRLNYDKKTPDHHLLTGHHRIQFKRNGYEDLIMDIVIKANEDITVEVPPLKKQYLVSFKTNVTLDSLYIDGISYNSMEKAFVVTEGEHYVYMKSFYCDPIDTTILLYSDTVFYMNLKYNIDTLRDFYIDEIGFNMVFVKGGSYYTSDPEKTNSKIKDSTQIFVSPFYICQTEVTRALWEAVNEGEINGNKSMDPVAASYNDVIKWIKVLNEYFSGEGIYFRLPTIEEWEFASRGGVNSRNFQYSGSNNIYEVAWYSDNCQGWYSVRNVAGKKQNELGLYDMSGNVSEWCQSESIEKFCCGGNYQSSPDKCRVDSKEKYYNLDRLYPEIGFRLVMELVE